MIECPHCKRKEHLEFIIEKNNKYYCRACAIYKKFEGLSFMCSCGQWEPEALRALLEGGSKYIECPQCECHIAEKQYRIQELISKYCRINSDDEKMTKYIKDRIYYLENTLPKNVGNEILKEFPLKENMVLKFLRKIISKITGEK